MARFSRALAALLGSGVPLLAALPIVKELVSNRVLADALDLAADALRSGGGLAAPLASTGLFPPLGLQMIGVGEQTGRLEEMLDSVAQLYEREVGAALERMLAVLEPALIVGMGVLIAGTILSLLVALMAIHDLPL
jgi:general secretion pathway protein F